ncbi:hypothetical protein [Leucobacter sp. W1038]|uniref:hypothetical protein n=1 Tax=Leucobacter sp. W1038 TaxID=3438281 RepID=UPI003D95C6A0
MKNRQNPPTTPALPVGHDDPNSVYYIPEALLPTYLAARPGPALDYLEHAAEELARVASRDKLGAHEPPANTFVPLNDDYARERRNIERVEYMRTARERLTLEEIAPLADHYARLAAARADDATRKARQKQDRVRQTRYSCAVCGETHDGSLGEVKPRRLPLTPGNWMNSTGTLKSCEACFRVAEQVIIRDLAEASQRESKVRDALKKSLS